VPPTFLLYLAGVVLAGAFPFIAVIAIRHATFPPTRILGIITLLAGVLGAVCIATIYAVLCFFFARGLSDTTAGEWLVAVASGFSLYSIPAFLLGKKFAI
jgi:hypothetical protein